MTMSRIGIIGSLRISPLSVFLGRFVIALQFDVKTPIRMHRVSVSGDCKSLHSAVHPTGYNVCGIGVPICWGGETGKKPKHARNLGCYPMLSLRIYRPPCTAR